MEYFQMEVWKTSCGLGHFPSAESIELIPLSSLTSGTRSELMPQVLRALLLTVVSLDLLAAAAPGLSKPLFPLQGPESLFRVIPHWLAQGCRGNVRQSKG